MVYLGYRILKDDLKDYLGSIYVMGYLKAILRTT